MKKCSFCKLEKELSQFSKGKPKKDGNYISSYCKGCSSIVFKAWKNNNRERYNARIYRNIKKYPEKTRARYAVRQALSTGELIRKSCTVCNEKKVEAHHPDYSKPLEVMWLCNKHHNQIHNKV